MATYYRRRLPPSTESFLAETGPLACPTARGRRNSGRFEEEAVWIFPIPSINVNSPPDDELPDSPRTSAFTIPTSLAASIARRSSSRPASQRSRSRDSQSLKEWETITQNPSEQSDQEFEAYAIRQPGLGDLLEGRMSGWEWTIDREETTTFATRSFSGKQTQKRSGSDVMVGLEGSRNRKALLPRIQERGLSFRLSSPSESLSLSPLKESFTPPNPSTLQTKHPFSTALLHFLQTVLFIDQSTIDLLLGRESPTSPIFETDASAPLQTQETHGIESCRPIIPPLHWDSPQTMDQTLRKGIQVGVELPASNIIRFPYELLASGWQYGRGTSQSPEVKEG